MRSIKTLPPCTLPKHFEVYQSLYDQTPRVMMADSGYDSEGNYEYVKTVFGNIKRNKKFVRFSLRSVEKVSIEAGLIALAQNLAKMARQVASKSPFLMLCPHIHCTKPQHPSKLTF